MKKFIEKLKKNKLTIICVIIMTLSLGIGIIYLEYDEIIRIIANISAKETIAFIICLPGLCILFIFAVKMRIFSLSSSEVNDYYTIAKKALSSSTRIIAEQIITDSNSNEEMDLSTSDIMELMLLNMKEIKEYYVLSKTMAKRSFFLAVIMCIFGFAIIAASIITIFVIDISFTQSMIPVIGGAIVEIIAGTSLVVYRKSLEQLNQYYESLHNNERFLSLVNLVDKLTDNKKDDAYINIINNQLDVLKKIQ